MIIAYNFRLRQTIISGYPMIDQLQVGISYLIFVEDVISSRTHSLHSSMIPSVAMLPCGCSSKV